jgi:hypothetical protein
LGNNLDAIWGRSQTGSGFQTGNGFPLDSQKSGTVKTHGGTCVVQSEPEGDQSCNLRMHMEKSVTTVSLVQDFFKSVVSAKPDFQSPPAHSTFFTGSNLNRANRMGKFRKDPKVRC